MLISTIQLEANIQWQWISCLRLLYLKVTNFEYFLILLEEIKAIILNYPEHGVHNK